MSKAFKIRNATNDGWDYVAGGYDDSAILAVYADTKEPTGFVNASNLAVDQAVIVTGEGTANRTLTLTPTNGTDFLMQYRGNRLTKTGVQTYNLTPHEALTTYKVYVYYTSTGVFGYSVNTPWNISAASAIPVSVCYWNGTEWRVSDETHGCTMDADTHAYNHHNEQARYSEGDGFDFTVTTTGNDSVTLSSGFYSDEDKRIYHNGNTIFDLWYREALSSPTKMRFATLADTSRPYKLNAGAPQYEDGFSFVDIPADGYFSVWLLGTHCKQAAAEIYIGAIAPQDYHVKIENARSEQWADLDVESRWIDEMCLMYKVIFQYTGGAVVYQEHLDVRGQKQQSDTTLQVDDVIIAGLTGNVIGNSGSVETALEALDNALTSVNYYVSSATVTDGTAVGTIANTLVDDGTYYQITEESGAGYTSGPIDVQLTIGNGAITAATLPTSLTLKVFYNGATVNHNVQLQIYRYGTTNAWQNMGAVLTSASTFGSYQFTLADYVGGVGNLSELVSGGNILIRAVHSAVNGVGTHYLRFDYVVAQKQVSATIDPTTVISQVITDGVTNKAPSEDAVYDALALKQGLSIVQTITPGGNATIDFNSGRFALFTTNAASTLTIPDWASATESVNAWLYVTQGGTAYQVTIGAASGTNNNVIGSGAFMKALPNSGLNTVDAYEFTWIGTKWMITNMLFDVKVIV